MSTTLSSLYVGPGGELGVSGPQACAGSIEAADHLTAPWLASLDA